VAVQDGNTPLLVAAKHNPDVEVLQALLGAGAGANAKDKVSPAITEGLRATASGPLRHCFRFLLRTKLGARPIQPSHLSRRC
jgi:ankyrin repeat protein